tara:strand:- start:1847 stop:2020 length:174 start_codon:yes stop_codon:yes gene_type:complete
MKKFLIIIIFIAGCSSKKVELNNNLFDFIFSNDLSFAEFKTKLKNYAENSPYPNIDD